jgi:Bacterial Ig-like domain (group 2)
MSWMRAGVLLAGALMVSAGCGSEPTNPDRCFIRLAVINPDPARLRVGDGVTLEAQVTDAPACLPSDARSLRWTSADPMIATVDALSGHVSAVRPGTTEITLTTAVTHTFLTMSSVDVSGP